RGVGRRGGAGGTDFHLALVPEPLPRLRHGGAAAHAAVRSPAVHREDPGVVSDGRPGTPAGPESPQPVPAADASRTSVMRVVGSPAACSVPGPRSLWAAAATVGSKAAPDSRCMSLRASSWLQAGR